MKLGDLTTLTNAKSWLNVSTTTDDVLLGRLVSSVSRYIQSWLNRTFTVATVTEQYNGTGTQRMLIRNMPLLAVASLVVDTTTIPASPDGVQAGYVFDGVSISLIGYYFTRGYNNVKVTYTWGFRQSGESATVPASVAYDIKFSSFSLPWNADAGIKYANTGVALTAVAGAPAQGQYQVDLTNEQYVFNAADAGAALLVDYSYTPQDVEQACIELLGLRYRERTRIGENSKSMGGEVISFSTKDMTDSVKTLLNQYRRVTAV